MSTLETNLIQPATGTALQVGASGDTITIPSGATFNVAGTVGTGFTQGITEFDQWRLTAAASNSQNPIASNLERSDTPTAPYIGTGMSQSSGIFTFPSTGIWKIETVFLFYNASGGSGNNYGYTSVTTDNGSYVDIVETVKLELGGGASVYGSMIFDVTNTTTHKVRFETTMAHSSDQVQGNTARNLTYFTFTRIGDT